MYETQNSECRWFSAKLQYHQCAKNGLVLSHWYDPSWFQNYGIIAYKHFHLNAPPLGMCVADSIMFYNDMDYEEAALKIIAAQATVRQIQIQILYGINSQLPAKASDSCLLIPQWTLSRNKSQPYKAVSFPFLCVFCLITYQNIDGYDVFCSPIRCDCFV